MIRLVVPAGKDIPAHDAPGEIREAFTASRTTQEFGLGQLIYLTAGDTHALRGIEDASLLVTILSVRE